MKPLQDGLFAVRVLRRTLRSMSIDESGKFEIDFRLRQKEGEFQQAIVLAHGVKVEALADDGMVVPGQAVKVNVIVANRGNGEVAIKNVKFDGFDAAAAGQAAGCSMTAFSGGGFFFPGANRRPAAPEAPMPSVRKDQVAHCEPTLTIPASARISEPYWHRKGEEGRYTFDDDAPFGLPMRPTPFYVQVTLALPGGEEVITGLPVQHRYEGDIFSGEKRSELLVVPAFSVRVTPQVAIVPDSAIRSTPARPTAVRPDGRALQGSAAGGGRGAGRGAAASRPAVAARPTPPPADAPPTANREIRVTVLNDTTGPADTSVKLELPQGWTATPGRPAGEVLPLRRIADGPLLGEAVVQHQRRRVSREGDRRRRSGKSYDPRLPGDRVPAHQALPHLRRRRCDAESDQRAGAANSDDRLRDGRWR